MRDYHVTVELNPESEVASVLVNSAKMQGWRRLEPTDW